MVTHPASAKDPVLMFNCAKTRDILTSEEPYLNRKDFAIIRGLCWDPTPVKKNPSEEANCFGQRIIQT
jgi:hypothetical protein